MKFSIVVPSFNQAQYLEDCFDSILMQRGVETEIIVMDGGSTDGSVEIIRHYQPKIARWRSESDAGQSSALNDGFRQATGDVFCWLCSDDYYLPGAFKTVASIFEAKNPSLVTGACIVTNTPNRSSRLSAFDSNGPPLRYANRVTQPSTFWRAEVWKNVGPLSEEYHYVMDWDWFVRAETLGYTIFPIPDTIAVFREYDGHKTGSSSSKRAKEHWQVWRKNLTPHEYESLNRANSKKFLVYRIFRATRLFIPNRTCQAHVVSRLFGWPSDPSAFFLAFGLAKTLPSGNDTQ